MQELETVIKAIRIGLEGHVQNILPKHAGDITGGKMLRGILTIMTHDAIAEKKNIDKALDLATVVELVQNISLKADSWIDGDLIRHGKPSFHLNQKDSETLLQIIYLLSLPYSLAGKYGTEYTKELVETQQAMSIGVLQEIKGGVKEKGLPATRIYHNILTKKTGILFSLASTYGAMAADADKKTVECFRQYGLSLGIAYQVGDDIADLQKVVQGEKSWGTEKLLLRAVQADELLKELKDDIKMKKVRPSKALELLNKGALQNRLTDMVNKELDNCTSSIAEIDIEEPYKSFLVEYPIFCVEMSREKQPLCALISYRLNRDLLHPIPPQTL